MPSVTLHNPEDKAAIKRALPTTTQVRLLPSHSPPHLTPVKNMLTPIPFTQHSPHSPFRSPLALSPSLQRPAQQASN